MDTTLTTTSSSSGRTNQDNGNEIGVGGFFYYKMASRMCLPGRNKLQQEGWR